MMVKRKLRKIRLWTDSHVPLPLLLVGILVILLLFMNEETSISRNYEYQKEIEALNKEIKECEDSAAYYRQKRNALLSNKEELEHLAREQYHMQRPTEDVFIVK
jgi:cell division protein FtsB